MRWFPRSIRWRLQLWYGVILLLVLAVFGGTADRLERSRQFRRIDHELQQRLSVLAAALRPGPPGGPPGMGPGPGGLPAPGPFGAPAEGTVGSKNEPTQDRAAEPEGERRRPGFRRGPMGDFEGPEGPRRFPPRLELRWSPEDAALFDRGETTPFYYLIWVRDGRLHSRSSTAPMPVPRPERDSNGGMPLLRTRGTLREAYLFGGPHDCFLVGRSIAPDLAEMTRHSLWLSAIGVAILIVGLAGGWWLAGRAIRPVEVISGTAARIATGDLSQRISLKDTESELGRLASVLNATFARLETAFAQQTQFTSDAAHELRTPVAVVLTQTQLALSRDRAAADYRDTIEACQRAAQRMRRLIESLMALARFDAGQETLHRTNFDLAETVRDCVELIAPLAREAGIPVEVDLVDLPCEGDSERLAQVIVNLLTNAIQYNRPGGKVRVIGRRQNGVLELEVSDTGPGIAQQDLPHVFDRFYRGDRARTGSANAGLGLAISKAIITAHSGSIECSSEIGTGATFKISLPPPAAASVA